jgi:cytoskeletal protein RodZ
MKERRCSVGNLGETLRERRVALGLTLEQVQEGVRIRQKLLDALEEGHYDRLPDPGYVRGYISSYARFLELDPVPLLNMYKAETGAGRFHELNLPQVEEAVARTGEQHAIPWKGAMAVAVTLGVISLVIWAVARISTGPETTPPIPPAATAASATVEPVSDEQAQEPEDQDKDDKKQSVSTERPFTLSFQVDAEGASWLKITVDGQPAYEGTLAGGQTKEFEVTSEASAKIGKPEAVTVLRDGEPVDIKTKNDLGVVTVKADSDE